MPTITSQAKSKAVHVRRGRRITSPATDLGKFIQQRLDSLGMTRVPALLNKINSTLQFARQRLQARRNDFPLLFDLDARDGQ